MASSEQSCKLPQPAKNEDEQDLPGIISDKYNTVFERIINLTQGDEPIPEVVACVAYALYKIEKRDWMLSRQKAMGRRPHPDEVDAYVSGWTDLRIESVIAQARNVITNFAESVLESSRDDINDQVYKGQFQRIHDLLASGSEYYRSEGEITRSHVTKSTKSKWFTSIAQNLIANFVWTVLVVVLLISLNVGFDFNNFGSRVRAFLQPPPESQTQGR